MTCSALHTYPELIIPKVVGKISKIDGDPEWVVSDTVNKNFCVLQLKRS